MPERVDARRLLYSWMWLGSVVPIGAAVAASVGSRGIPASPFSAAMLAGGFLCCAPVIAECSILSVRFLRQGPDPVLPFPAAPGLHPASAPSPWRGLRAWLSDGIAGRGWQLPGTGSAAALVPDGGPFSADPASGVAAMLSAGRAAARMTQEHLAAAACVSVRTVSRAERTGRLSAENMRSMCAVLEIPLRAAPSVPAGGVPPWAVAAAAASAGARALVRAPGALGRHRLFGPCWFASPLALAAAAASYRPDFTAGCALAGSEFSSLACAASGTEVWGAAVLITALTLAIPVGMPLADAAAEAAIPRLRERGASGLAGMLFILAMLVPIIGTVLLSGRRVGAIHAAEDTRAAAFLDSAAAFGSDGRSAALAHAFLVEPLAYAALGLPAPDWTRDPAAWEARRAEEGRRR